MTYKDNPNRKVYNIDLDGTLTTGTSYEKLEPDHDMIKKVQKLYHTGHIIIIWSARLWSDASFVVGWLVLQNIPFHGIMLGKGGTDCYVDDKAINSKDFLTDLREEFSDVEIDKEAIRFWNEETNYMLEVEKKLKGEDWKEFLGYEEESRN